MEAMHKKQKSPVIIYILFAKKAETVQAVAES